MPPAPRAPPKPPIRCGIGAGAGLTVAPGERQDGVDAPPRREAARQRARFRRSAENEQREGASGEASMTGERWLAIVGLGEDGIDGLPPAARTLLAQAGLVVGGRRHLALVQPTRPPKPISGRRRSRMRST